jgi:hypothetical protein
VVKERNIEFLLKKYETKQPGEVWETQKETETKKVWRIKQKLRYADYVLKELNMKGIQKDQVYFIINKISDLQLLCRTCSYEKIITVICFYIKFCTTPKVALMDYNKYKVCREHEMTLELYSKVITNLAKFFQGNTPVSAGGHVI